MAPRFFLNKAFSKLERIDKDSLARLAIQLTHENKFLEELIEELTIGILVFDQELKIRMVNRLMRLWLGLPNTKTNFPQTLPSALNAPDLLKKIAHCVETESEIFDEPFELYSPRHTRGSWGLRKFRTNSTTAQGELWYVLILQSDSSRDEKQRERQHAERLNSILTLASGIAHELGNPLNSIGVHLQLMSADISKIPEPHRAKLRKSIEIVQEEAGRLDKIVRNFLKSTRQKPLYFQIADIHEPIQQTLLLLEPELKDARISVETDFDRNLPEFYIDAERLSRVFINLIKNAVQAMPKGGTIRISTNQKRNACEIKISDTGSGIKQSELPKIFDAYYTTKEEGSGLGLVISYQIIREHSGKIEVESKLGKGTAITVTLPIRKEKLQLPAPKERAGKHGTFI